MTFFLTIYLAVGVLCALSWGAWDRCEHYAVAGPTSLGRILGATLVPALLVALWPVYWRARSAARARKHDATWRRDGRAAADPLET